METKENMPKWVYFVLVLLFVLVLGSRLYISFQVPHFSDDKSYFHLEQVHSILDTGLPVFESELSYSGSLNVFSPVFDYILALFSVFLPVVFVLKVLPNLFASSLVFVIFYLVLLIVKNYRTALFTAFVSGFIPVFFSRTVNSVSIYSLVVPLVFLQFYLFIRLIKSQHKKTLYYYLASLLVLSVLHPAVLIYLISIVLYLVLSGTEDFRITRGEFEIVLFSSFLVLWVQFVLYKKIIMFHGANVLWQNLPAILLSDFFSSITILDAVIQIGLVIFICGIYMIYRYLFGEKDKDSALFLAIALTVSVITWLKLIELEIGLIFIGCVLVLYFGEFVEEYKHYFRRTHLEKFSIFVTLAFFILFVITSVIPSLSFSFEVVENGISSGELDAYLWLGENTPEGSVVLATPEEGYLISAVSSRKNVIETNYLLKTDVEKRYNDISIIYTSRYQVEAFRLLEKYEVDYFVVSQKTHDYYGVEEPFYFNEKCFDLIYEKETKIYKIECKIK